MDAAATTVISRLFPTEQEREVDTDIVSQRLIDGVRDRTAHKFIRLVVTTRTQVLDKLNRAFSPHTVAFCDLAEAVRFHAKSHGLHPDLSLEIKFDQGEHDVGDVIFGCYTTVIGHRHKSHEVSLMGSLTFNAGGSMKDLQLFESAAGDGYLLKNTSMDGSADQLYVINCSLVRGALAPHSFRLPTHTNG